MDHATTRLTAAGEAQPPGKHLSVAAKASLMNRGRGRQLLILSVGVALLGAAGLLLLQRITRGAEYTQAAAETARIEREHFDAFFGCALPGVRRWQLSAERVHSGFESLGNRLGKSYGKTLVTCLPQMQALTTGVQGLQVPADVEPERAQLLTAATALAAANTQYLHYLSDDAQDYEFVAALPLLDKFGAAWAGYDVAQGDLKRALEERM